MFSSSVLVERSPHAAPPRLAAIRSRSHRSTSESSQPARRPCGRTSARVPSAIRRQMAVCDSPVRARTSGSRRDAGGRVDFSRRHRRYRAAPPPSEGGAPQPTGSGSHGRRPAGLGPKASMNAMTWSAVASVGERPARSSRTRSVRPTPGDPASSSLHACAPGRRSARDSNSFVTVSMRGTVNAPRKPRQSVGNDRRAYWTYWARIGKTAYPTALPADAERVSGNAAKAQVEREVLLAIRRSGSARKETPPNAKGCRHWQKRGCGDELEALAAGGRVSPPLARVALDSPKARRPVGSSAEPHPARPRIRVAFRKSARSSTAWRSSASKRAVGRKPGSK